MHPQVLLWWCQISFFRAFNATLSKTGRCAPEPVVLSLLRSKCMPILLYAVEACPLLASQTLSFEFTLTRIFMTLFRTDSSKVLNECQVSFGFLPAKSQILFCRSLLCLKIAYACCLWMMRVGSYIIFFIQFGDNIQTSRQLRSAVFVRFFDKS